MNQHWQRYRNEMRRYVRFALFAPLIALLPFLNNLQSWRDNEGLWFGLGASLLFGTIIGLTIFALFSAIYAGLTMILIRTGRFYQPPVLIQIVLGSFGALTGMWLVAWLRTTLFGAPMEAPPFVSTLVFSGMIATAISLYFAYRNAREESLTFRAEAAEARYHTLERQMRPHFLFNALNSLAELIESGEENAAETTYKLSDLYRQILANSGVKTASLHSELEIVRRYLDLEQLRFGARLRFDIRVPKNNQEIFLPSLMLQTLVENAVKHGIAPAVEGGEIEIVVTQQSEHLYQASVRNTGRHYQADASAKGVGLANTRARLDLLYGACHEFTIGSDEQGHTVAAFHFTGERIE